MTMQTVGKLSHEDLLRWRVGKARLEAAEMTSESIEFDTLVGIYMEHYELTAEMVDAYDIDDEECWHISQYTGNITYCDG